MESKAALGHSTPNCRSPFAISVHIRKLPELKSHFKNQAKVTRPSGWCACPQCPPLFLSCSCRRATGAASTVVYGRGGGGGGRKGSRAAGFGPQPARSYKSARCGPLGRQSPVHRRGIRSVLAVGAGLFFGISPPSVEMCLQTI
ncbi:hypothetical protein M5D96_009910 [Drosophila gunungcola]|uniref:Uncharacterized protein n=1 Tax=Drosophila gunungcola TaxID=103775 RepID=A0A9P9YIF0_9MUSC|nr:hypothetical protein M5D96_009910 [Drosophila gunungcola]